MTTPDERSRALVQTGAFLAELALDARAPMRLRRTAAWLTRHYPTASQVERMAFDCGMLDRQIDPTWSKSYAKGPLTESLSDHLSSSYHRIESLSPRPGSQRYFLGTSWADPDGHELVALALVSEDGQRHFYRELKQLPRSPTRRFMDETYPYLRGGKAERSKKQFALDLRTFFRRDDAPEVVTHFKGDDALFDHALRGFDVAEPVGEPDADDGIGEDSLGLIPLVDVVDADNPSEIEIALKEYGERYSDWAPHRRADYQAEALRWAYAVVARGRAIYD